MKPPANRKRYAMSENTSKKNYVYSFNTDIKNVSVKNNASQDQEKAADQEIKSAPDTVIAEDKAAMQAPAAAAVQEKAAVQDPHAIQEQPEVYDWDMLPPLKRSVKIRRRRLRKTLCVLAILLLTALSVTLLLSVEKHSAVPVHGSTPDLNANETLQTLRKKFATNSEQNSLTMVLSADELNSYLPWIFDQANSGYKEELQVNGVWENGKFKGAASVFCWKAYINVRFTAELLYKDNKLDLVITNTKLGKLPLPGFITSMISKKILAALEADKDYRQIMKSVKNINVTPDGSLLLTFDNDTTPVPDYAKNPVEGSERFGDIMFSKLLLPLSEAQNQKFFTAKLSTSDINILFANIISNFWAPVRQEDEPMFYALWQEDWLNIHAVLFNEHKVPLNCYVALRPEIKDGEIFVKIKEARIGKMQLPAAFLEEKLQKKLTRNACKTGYAKIMQLCNLTGESTDKLDEALNALHEVVNTLKFTEDKNLLIEADPKQTRTLIQSMM